MQTVKGVESNNPTGPHSAAQKIAATKIARDETPVCAAYNSGSITYDVRISITTNDPNASRGFNHPSKTASDNKIGIAAPTRVPRYGTNLRSAASTPQRNALGTPMK